jgi:hypothetical protein
LIEFFGLEIFMMKTVGMGGLLGILLVSCSQLGPNDGILRNSLQSQLPAYWEVSALNLENRENLGSQADPNIQARFKAVLRLKEDTFNKVEQSNPLSYAILRTELGRYHSQGAKFLEVRM